MKSLKGWFNIYFVSALALLAVAPGCTSGHFGKKQIATIRLYLESRNQDTAGGSVLVTRSRIPITIERESFIDEGDVASARLLDEPDGTFAIELHFKEHGANLLEMNSIGSRGRRIVIFSHFPPPGTKQDLSSTDPESTPASLTGASRHSGWISALTIKGRLTGGTLVFTPDTSRTEAEAIVKGLNNVAKKAPK